MREIIVAQGLTPSPSDQAQIVALVDGIDLGRTPKEASADSGYLSEANLEALADRSIAAYIATGRAKHPTGERCPNTRSAERGCADQRSSRYAQTAAIIREFRSGQTSLFGIMRSCASRVPSTP